MDEDDDVILQLQCDVEMRFEGPNDTTLNKWAADALRRLADSIERDELENRLSPREGQRRHATRLSSMKSSEPGHRRPNSLGSGFLSACARHRHASS
jgi:hypothetical protein